MQRLLIPIYLLIAALLYGCGASAVVETQAPIHARAEDGSISESYNLLRSSPEEKAPKPLEAHWRRLLRRQIRGVIEPSHVQRVRTPVGVVWVFQIDDGICLAQGGRGSIGCSRGAEARTTGVSLGVFDPPSHQIERPHNFILYALIPDGTDRIPATIGDQQRAIHVRHNLVSVSSRLQPVLIEMPYPARQYSTGH
jgi:hypothetical protein